MVAQAIFIASNWPRLGRLFREKRSTQHSLVYGWLVAIGHCLMLIWAIVVVRDVVAVTAYSLALGLAVFTALVVHHYRGAEK